MVRNLEPLRVKVKLPDPARIDKGEIALITGTGLLMVKVKELEGPPPGEGLVTEMVADPAVVMAVAGMLAVSWVLLTNCVGTVWVLNVTVEVLINLLPFKVRVKPVSSAVTVTGERLVKTGTGLGS